MILRYMVDILFDLLDSIFSLNAGLNDIFFDLALYLNDFKILLAPALITVMPYFKAALFFIPWKTFAGVIYVVVIFLFLRIVIAFVKMIWDLLPLA